MCAQDPIKRRQRGQSEAEAEGRLALPILRSLLEDSRSPKFSREGKPDVKLLAQRCDVSMNLSTRIDASSFHSLLVEPLMISSKNVVWRLTACVWLAHEDDASIKYCFQDPVMVADSLYAILLLYTALLSMDFMQL